MDTRRESLTGSACTANHETELNTLLDILLPPNLHLRQAHFVSNRNIGGLGCKEMFWSVCDDGRDREVACIPH